MRKRSGQVHSRESSATLQLTVSLLYPLRIKLLTREKHCPIIVLKRTMKEIEMYFWDKHKTITSYYELLSGEVCDRYGLTQMEYDILMFLHNNPQHNTAAEIVKIRKSTKSHVSTSLKDLENKGLIKKIQSEDNKKHIEIVLLDKAELIVEAGINAQKQFAQNVLSGLTEDEKHICINIFDKICCNAEESIRAFQLMEKEQ